MHEQRIVLLSGMGGDGRLMRPLQVPGASLFTPDHLPPDRGESLQEYAARVADSHAIVAADIIGGASFGGMVAAEISRQRRVTGLILLGTCAQPARLPWSYRWAERVGRLIPDFFLSLRLWSPLVKWRFAPISAEAKACLVSMARDCPPGQLREFGRMALHWSGVDRFSCPTVSIHGDRDRVIPLSCSDPDIILKGAGHAFTLTHVPETVRAIKEFIGRISH